MILKDPKIVTTLQKVKAGFNQSEDQFTYTFDLATKHPKSLENHILKKEDFGLVDSNFESSYAHVNRAYYQQNAANNTSYINKMINVLKAQNSLFNPNKLTFESSISHLSADFKANVDYIWYNKNNVLKPYKILELPLYEQLPKNKSILIIFPYNNIKYFRFTNFRASK